jgi:hypothetical protein
MVKPWKEMTVSDTANQVPRRFSWAQMACETALRTSTRPLVRARPPVAEWETWIASRFGEQLGHATMIDKTNLSRRDFLANPVRGDLIHAQRKNSQISPSNQRATAASRALRPSLESQLPTLSEIILLCPACNQNTAFLT